MGRFVNLSPPWTSSKWCEDTERNGIAWNRWGGTGTCPQRAYSREYVACSLIIWECSEDKPYEATRQHATRRVNQTIKWWEADKRSIPLETSRKKRKGANQHDCALQRRKEANYNKQDSAFRSLTGLHIVIDIIVKLELSKQSSL